MPAIVATTEYVYLAADWEVARYTMDGTPLAPWSFERAGEIEDLARIKEDLLVVRTQRILDEETNLSTARSILERIDKEGTIVWTHMYPEPGWDLARTKLAVRGEKIYVAFPAEKPCSNCEASPEFVFALRVHGPDGTLELSKDFRSSDPLGRADDLEVTSAGRIFVATSRTIPNPQERIADLDPVLDSLDYPEAVDFVEKDVVVEFDSAAEFVRDYPVRNLFNDPVQLGSDEIGHAYALCGSYALTNAHPSRAYLVRFAQGKRTEQFEVNLTRGDWPRIMTRSGDGFAFVGRDLIGNSSIFVKMDLLGNVSSRKLLEQFNSSTSLVEAPSGELFLGGRVDGRAFVAPWPE